MRLFGMQKKNKFEMIKSINKKWIAKVKKIGF